MLKAGLTGGIGAGKTYVCRIFESMGIPVYYADDMAKYLMQHDSKLIAAIKQQFGEAIYQNGQLDRPRLATLVFNNSEALGKLNKIVHPAVFMDGLRWQEEHKNAPYTIREAALIFETGLHQHLDKVITVTAPFEVRIQRVMLRDNVSRESILARIANQLEDEEKVKRADYVIYNDNDHPLMPQIEETHRQLLSLANLF